MTDEQSRDGIPPEQTARYAELARKHGAGPLPMLEKMEALEARAEAAERERDEAIRERDDYHRIADAALTAEHKETEP